MARALVRRICGLAAVSVAAALLAACSSGGSSPQAVASGFLADWAHRDWAGMRALTSHPQADLTRMSSAAIADLSVRHASYTAGRMVVSGAAAHEPVTQHLQLAGLGTITIHSVLRLVKSVGGWQVDWSPATIAPQLKPGDHLSLQVTWPARAQILGAGGVALTRQAAVVIVGVEGQLIRNDGVVEKALLAAGAPKRALAAALAGAKAEPTWFEPVFTVSWARYQQLKPAIYPVPGTVFQRTTQREPITPGLGYVVGSVGPITAQELRQLGPPYTAASVVGQTGLELAYQRQLAGRPSVTVTVADSSGSAVATVTRLGPRPGTPVRTSIVAQVQRNAEAVLAGQHGQAALTVVAANTGAVLAAVSVPAGGAQNLALEGEFPPGSAFKIITSTALLEHGLTPSSAASCPPQLTVDGETFHNTGGEAPVSDLLHAFAESCNTAFIGLATRNLTAADFPAAAAQYGIGTQAHLGLPAFLGAVPQPSDEADLAATTIGQGRVLMSPLAMAMVAAAVDSGVVRGPSLVSGVPGASGPVTRLPASVVTGLHQMMAQVVATGTASGEGLPAGTYAKTGTAQYGTSTPLKQDAWLVGFNGDIAFAMVTVNGGEGGPTDGPLVARFLDLVRSAGG